MRNGGASWEADVDCKIEEVAVCSAGRFVAYTDVMDFSQGRS